MATKVYPTHYPENPPEWYWARGLHDASIADVEEFEFPFDYNKFVGQKSNYNRNLLKLKIDSKGAMYDTSVKEIHFYNYKVLTSDISLKNRKIMWWISDRLIASRDHFVLEIDLHDFDSYPEDFTFKIRFQRAEVVRAGTINYIDSFTSMVLRPGRQRLSATPIIAGHQPNISLENISNL